MSSSPGAASFSTLSSYASSAPDRQESHAGNFPLPVTATAPTTTTGTTHLSPSSATSNSKYVQTPSSANAANAANANASNPPNNSSNSITPNHTPDARDTPNHHLHLRPRTATLNYKLLPHLETGLHTNSLDDHICQLHYRDTIYNHPIQEFFSSVSSSSFSSMYHPSSSSSSSSNNNNYDYTDEEKGGVNEE
ncbi:hypothetical protein SMACR_09074 [Sordaria macrospora]|uniref:Uncharacterized protein n=1 Tax=Sordaria macrospora TaxID=5147 RepID=A0A8S9A473_SORMA|nr:hypothetical protein SMACR_09074 [Sordaria macrospora]WPJ57398.1 hypothetical protein SMAC4_09074 [Sordaria macrospora]